MKTRMLLAAGAVLALLTAPAIAAETVTFWQFSTNQNDIDAWNGAIKAFEANSVDYLLKPFSKERFDTAIEKYRKQHPSGAAAVENVLKATHRQAEERHRIVVRNGVDIRIVPVQDIHYMEAYDDYVKIFTADTYYLKKKTMSYYEQVLDPAAFFRTHRSFIINLEQLTKVEQLEKNTYLAILKSGKKIPLSRGGYVKLKEQLGI